MPQAPSVTVTNPNPTPAHTPADEPIGEPSASYPSADQVNQAIDTFNALSAKMKAALRHSWTNSEDVLQLDNGVAHHSTKSALRSRGLIVEGGVALTNMGKLVRTMLLRGVAEVVKWAEKGRAETRIDQPDHELIGKRVHGYFARKDSPTLEITGKAIGAYLSHEMHGSRVQMITVACDDGKERITTRFSVSVLADERTQTAIPDTEKRFCLNCWESLQEDGTHRPDQVCTNPTKPVTCNQLGVAVRTEMHAIHADPTQSADALLTKAQAAVGVADTDEFGVLTVSQLHHRYIQVAARGDYDRTLRDGLEQELRLRELDELAELLSTVSAANRSGGWHHPVDRSRTLARVRELVTEHGKSTRLQPVPAPTTKDPEVKVEVARKTVSIYRVEFSNTPADELHADPVTIAAATEDELVASIANQFLDDDEPSTENLTADFDVLGGSPDFGSGPVDGLVSISADESVCAFTATRIDTFEIPKDIDLDNDDTLMGNRVVVHAHKPGKAYVGTVVAAGLDQSLDHGQKVYTAVVVVKCDDGEIRISPRRDAWSVPKDTATR